MTTTRTTTHTITKTREEFAVLAAIELSFEGRRQSYEMERIFDIVHEQAGSATPGQPKSGHESTYIDVPDWLTPVIVGQLIERRLVYRGGTYPETYSRA